MQPANIVKGPKVMLELDMSSIQRISKVILFCGASAVLGCDNGAGKPDALSDSGCDTLRYPDTDGDGFGNAALAERRCAADGWVTRGNDCDDDDARVNPEAAEVCDADNVDENCDGAANDETAQDAQYWFKDADGDNYGSGAPSGRRCDPADDEADNDDDCDDDDPTVNPAAVESCDAKDNNCNGDVDEGEISGEEAAGASIFYADTDADGWGNEADVAYACAVIEGHVEQNGDCDDGNPSINPDAEELCDGIDQNCDGFLDNRCETLHTATDADWSYPYPEADGPEDLNTSLLVASDLTGDGIDDLLVGFLDHHMLLLEGPVSEASEPLWTVDFPSNSTATGLGVTIDTDFNGDGIPDMAIPVLYYEGDPLPAIMVFNGPFLETPNWSTPDHTLVLDSAYSLAGLSGLSAADFTGDGAMDLAFDTHGAGIDLYLWDDVGSSATATLGSDDTFSWSGTVDGGGSINLGIGPNRGDFNGDGGADMVHVGPGEHDLSILLGPISPDTAMESDLILSDPDDNRSFTHDLCIADFDGDGRDEIGVSARRADEDATFESDGVELWVFDPTESEEYPVLKITEGEEPQVAAYTCTDVDGDGQVDVLMQRPVALNSVGYEVGAVHLFFGALEGTRSEDSADHVFMAEAVDSYFGTLVSTGDHDNNGHDDVIIGGRTSDIMAFSSDDWRSPWWSAD